MLAVKQVWPSRRPARREGHGVVVPNAAQLAGVARLHRIKRRTGRSPRVFGRARAACYLFDPSLRTAVPPLESLLLCLADPVRRLNDLQRIAEMLYPDPPNVDPVLDRIRPIAVLSIALYLFETPTLRTHW